MGRFIFRTKKGKKLFLKLVGQCQNGARAGSKLKLKVQEKKREKTALDLFFPFFVCLCTLLVFEISINIDYTG